jgi:hypothetical protein
MAWLLLSSCVSGQTPIFLDTRLLVAAHPLMKDYDHITHRFRGSPSEPIEGGQPALEELQAQIQRLEKNGVGGASNLPRMLENAPAAARARLEKEYLASKKGRSNELSDMKQRLYFAMQIPGRPGVTPVNSIFPEIQEILGDVKGVVAALQRKYQAPLVIDISSLYAYPPRDNLKTQLLLQNQHFNFWRGKTDHPDSLGWIKEAKDFLGKQGDGALVVPFGAVDVRLESVKLLEENLRRKR